MKTTLAKIVRSGWFLAGGGIVLGAFVVMGIRFATYSPNTVHYHANFALYINGQQEMFQSPLYYSEVEMCTTNTAMVPAERAHMHDNVNNVVHVEDQAVTWGQFFSSIGWYMGPDFMQSPSGMMYTTSGVSQLHLMLNGQDYTGLGGLANRVIGDKDKLLVSYGDVSDGQLKQEFTAMPSTAHRYDEEKDPSSCGGHSGSSMHDRFTHMF